MLRHVPRTLLLPAALAVAAAGLADAQETEIEDPDARRIHARMMEAMGGEDAWDRTRYLEFDWLVARPEGEPLRRSHRWDRWTGRHRVEAPSDGGAMVAVFDSDEPADGRVWIGGSEVTGARADSLLRRANAMYVNDSYWLVMPYKWTDPGAHLAYLGRKTDDGGESWEVVELSFEPGVGLTPRNVYHAWVDPETWLMERWYHFRREGADPLVTDWTEWVPCGPIRLARDRPFRSSEGRIHFEGLRCETRVPDGAFAPPG